jgi:hypothetical protein
VRGPVEAEYAVNVMHTRRWLFRALGAVPALSFAQRGQAPKPQPLDLSQFEPRSMLHVPETPVPRAKFPLIDIHTHLTWGDPRGESSKLLMPVDEMLAVMDRRNIRVMVCLTGGYGKALEDTVRQLHTPHPTRFLARTAPEPAA